MKLLTVIIHNEAKQNLIDTLMDMKEVGGFTAINAEGHSRKGSKNPFESNHDLVAGYLPRVRVDILVAPHAIERILSSLSHCESCVEGTGLYWVSEIESSGAL